MNQTEKRRKKLLEEMRNLYSDKGTIPAIHPRYKSAFQQLYPNESEMKKGTFGIRCGICIVIFILYMMTEVNSIIKPEIHNIQIREKIVQNYLSELY